MTNEILRLEHITKIINQKPIVDDLCLSLYQGEIFGLLGQNGSGKSTTLKLIANIIKPSSGAIYRTSDLNKPIKIRLKLEDPPFYEHLTVFENLMIHLKYMKYYDLEKVNELLSLVNITAYKNVKISEISLGTKQRLAIARAISDHPDILLLDEPTNGLDPVGIMDLRCLLKQLSKHEGMSIILSSHLINEIEQVSDRVGIMKQGHMIKSFDLTYWKKNAEHSFEHEVMHIMNLGIDHEG